MAQNAREADRRSRFDPYTAIRWNDRRLCDSALTHSTAANENGCQSNERFEFLGDSVLDLLCAEWLMRSNPNWDPGTLSEHRMRRVCRENIARQARSIGLDRWIRLGRGAELQGLRQSEKVLGDALEALIGAAYQDGGGSRTKWGLIRAGRMAAWAGLLL